MNDCVGNGGDQHYPSGPHVNELNRYNGRNAEHGEDGGLFRHGDENVR